MLTKQQVTEDMVKRLIKDQHHLNEQPTGSFNRSSNHIGGKMKIRLMQMLLVLGLLAGVANVTTRAQALSDDTAIQANVPHAFIVKDKTLPAGKYTIKRVDVTEPKVLEIRSARGGAAVIFEAETAQADQMPRKAELIFDKVGDQYFLSQIWTPDSRSGYQLPKTKAQEGLERAGSQAEHHSIVAKQSKKNRKG